ncbi:hypothetical protein DPK35_24910 [Salmonella enterica subsp. enterica]|nr:hypothetical protein [Salmonella enterica subsp. enterica serovar Sandiego]
MKHIISLLTLLVACGLSSNLFAEGKDNSDIPLNYSYSAASKMILPVNYGAGTCHLITDPLDITIHPPFTDTAHSNEVITIQVLYNNSGNYTSQLGENNIDGDIINKNLPLPSQNTIRYINGIERLPFMPYIKAFGGKIFSSSASSNEIQNFSPASISQSTAGSGVLFTIKFKLTPNQEGKKYSDITFTLPSRDILYLQIRYDTTVNTGFAIAQGEHSYSGGYAVRWVRKDIQNEKVNYLTLSDNDDWSWINTGDIAGIKVLTDYLPVNPAKDYTIKRQSVSGLKTALGPQASLGIYSSVVNRDGYNPSIDKIDAFQDYFRFSKKNILSNCSVQGNGNLDCNGFQLQESETQLDGSPFNLNTGLGIDMDRGTRIASILPSNILRGTLNPYFIPSFSSTSKAWFDSQEYDNYKGSFTLKEIVSKMDYISDNDNTDKYGRFNLVNTEALDIYVGEPLHYTSGAGATPAIWRSFGIYGEPMIFRPTQYKDNKDNVNIISPKDLRNACY